MKLAHDARWWFKKWSTWLSLASSSFGAGALAFSSMPAQWQAEFPAGIGGYLAMAAVGTALLVPIATSLSQRNIPTKEEE